jgi:hypothetical protein
MLLVVLAAELGARGVQALGLERRVWGRWRPFLRAMLTLLRVAGWGECAAEGAMEVDAAPADDDMAVPALLARLGMPATLVDGELASVVAIFRAWAQQYRAFVASLPLAGPPSPHPPPVLPPPDDDTCAPRAAKLQVGGPAGTLT